MISANEKSPLLPPKRLKTDNPDGEKIRVAEFGAAEEEAHWVASEIERLHGPGNPWRNFAVLYRKHTHRDKLLEALQRRGIPFVIKTILDTFEHDCARSAGVPAADRDSFGQRGMRAGAGSALLGS